MSNVTYKNLAASHSSDAGRGCCCMGCLSDGTQTSNVVAGFGVTSPYTDAIDWGTQVNSGQFNTQGAMIIDVHFDAGGGFYGGFGGYETFAWTAYERQQFLEALSVFETFLDLDFRETSSASAAEFTLYNVEASGAFLGIFGPPGTSAAGDGVFAYDGQGWDYQNLTGGLEQGGYGFVTMIHEVGHGLGLAHPHDAGGGSGVIPGVSDPFSDTGINDLNQGVFTMMSYVDGWVTNPNPDPNHDINDVSYGWQGTPMALDIAVLQDKYGANMSYATGNGRYLIPEDNGPGTFYACIWDAGGTDTIRYNGSRNVVIDLRAATLLQEPGGGGWVSHAAGIEGGYTIAHGVEIERAWGGSGRDTIVSNEYDNVLRGNGGRDTFVFLRDQAGDTDRIVDFSPGNDRIDVDDFLPDFNPLRNVPGMTFQLVNGAAEISYLGETIIIDGITDWDQIAQSDFILT